MQVEIIAICDSEGLADDSDVSRYSIDSEIRRADFRNCVQCKKPNDDPLFRYCESCYQVEYLFVQQKCIESKGACFTIEPCEYFIFCIIYGRQKSTSIYRKWKKNVFIELIHAFK